MDSNPIDLLVRFIPTIKGISDSNRKGLLHLTRQLQEERNALRHALAFYADSKRHQGPNKRPVEDDPYTEPGAPYMQDVVRDSGELAQAALEFHARR